MTDDKNPQPPSPASLRLGSPKEIGSSACERRVADRYNDSFASYLKNLQEEQKSLFTGNGGYQKKALYNQMDLLDALFTYLAVNADWKNETPQSYNAALRAQKQFCDTIKMMHALKKPAQTKNASPASPSSSSIIQ
jgi:hypothetical protein